MVNVLESFADQVILFGTPNLELFGTPCENHATWQFLFPQVGLVSGLDSFHVLLQPTQKHQIILLPSSLRTGWWAGSFLSHKLPPSGVPLFLSSSTAIPFLLCRVSTALLSVQRVGRQVGAVWIQVDDARNPQK